MRLCKSAKTYRKFRTKLETLRYGGYSGQGKDWQAIKNGQLSSELSFAKVNDWINISGLQVEDTGREKQIMLIILERLSIVALNIDDHIASKLVWRVNFSKWWSTLSLVDTFDYGVLIVTSYFYIMKPTRWLRNFSTKLPDPKELSSCWFRIRPKHDPRDALQTMHILVDLCHIRMKSNNGLKHDSLYPRTGAPAQQCNHTYCSLRPYNKPWACEARSHDRLCSHCFERQCSVRHLLEKHESSYWCSILHFVFRDNQVDLIILRLHSATYPNIHVISRSPDVMWFRPCFRSVLLSS